MDSFTHSTARTGPKDPPPPEHPPSHRKDSTAGGSSLGSSLVRWALIAIGSFLAGVVLFNLIVIPAIIGHGDEVKVPDVLGRALPSAKDMIEDEGLKVGALAEQWSGVYPDGYVIGQTPAALSRVKRGREVRLVVSAGREGQEVPDLTGIAHRDAQVAIARAGLRVGRIVRAYSETAAKEEVLATDPEPGARAEPGGRVDLLVSLGARAEPFLLPDLRGRSIDEVRRFFGSSGIRLVERPREVYDVPAGQVLEQTPPRGSRIRSGELVEVVVSSSSGRGWQ